MGLIAKSDKYVLTLAGHVGPVVSNDYLLQQPGMRSIISRAQQHSDARWPGFIACIAAVVPHQLAQGCKRST